MIRHPSNRRERLAIKKIKDEKKTGSVRRGIEPAIEPPEGFEDVLREFEVLQAKSEE